MRASIEADSWNEYLKWAIELDADVETAFNNLDIEVEDIDEEDV